MKKTILALLLSVLMITTLFAVDYTIELVDSYGDGWNGGVVSVSVNGTVVLADLTLASGSGPESHTFAVEAEDLIEADYEAGSYGYENEYQILDDAGVVVAESGQGGVEPGDVSYNVPAAGSPDAPVLVTPLAGATNVAIDGNLEWTTGDNTDHAVLYIAEDAAFTSPTTVDPATSPYTTSLDNATTYYWKVVAVNGALEATSAVRSFTTELAEGTYIMALFDSYGDGWNGGAIDILLDGVVIFDDVTVDDDVNYLLFEAELGQTISTDFHTPGSFPGECSFELYDYQETLLASGDQYTEINYFLAFPGSPDVPTLVSPVNGATNVALVSDLEWTTTGGNTDALALYLADNAMFTGATVAPLLSTDVLYTTASLAVNTTYYWKVVAINNTDVLETPSAVWSFTTEYGVATIPYSQNFDSYEFGDQPDGWISLNTTGSTTVVTSVSTTNPVSTPNSYRIYNAYASSGNILVSTPKVPTMGNRVRFSARTSTTLADSVIVGTMTDATDELTFVPIATLALTTTHSLFMVELPDTAGEQYVTFKHARIGTARSI